MRANWCVRMAAFCTYFRLPVADLSMSEFGGRVLSVFSTTLFIFQFVFYYDAEIFEFIYLELSIISKFSIWIVELFVYRCRLGYLSACHFLASNQIFPSVYYV